MMPLGDRSKNNARNQNRKRPAISRENGNYNRDLKQAKRQYLIFPPHSSMEAHLDGQTPPPLLPYYRFADLTPRRQPIRVDWGPLHWFTRSTVRKRLRQACADWTGIPARDLIISGIATGCDPILTYWLDRLCCSDSRRALTRHPNDCRIHPLIPRKNHLLVPFLGD